MRIKVEIDVKPEELRRFLGLPDVAGLQEELMQFLRDKVAADPAGFVFENLQQLGRSRAVQRLLYGNEPEKRTGRARRRRRNGGTDNGDSDGA